MFRGGGDSANKRSDGWRILCLALLENCELHLFVACLRRSHLKLIATSRLSLQRPNPAGVLNPPNADFTLLKLAIYQDSGYVRAAAM